jgi:hypothetical protein
MNKEIKNKCDYKDCDSDATKSIRITINLKDVDENYCVGHYWTVATNHYGSE